MISGDCIVRAEDLHRANRAEGAVPVGWDEAGGCSDQRIAVVPATNGGVMPDGHESRWRHDDTRPRWEKRERHRYIPEERRAPASQSAVVWLVVLVAALGAWVTFAALVWGHLM